RSQNRKEKTTRRNSSEGLNIMTEEVCKAREILWQDMTELEVEVERQRKAGFGCN
ncbi:hypothetical protein Pcinc_013917, partial [Petrolisthes cinctipes]